MVFAYVVWSALVPERSRVEDSAVVSPIIKAWKNFLTSLLET